MVTPSILVLGLGELGEEVVKSLATHPQRNGTKLAVLLRSKKLEQMSQLAAWGVDMIQADVVEDSSASLSMTFKAFSTVICCVGMFAPPETQIKICKAVLAAGVNRYFPWQFGIDYDTIGRGQAQDLFDRQLDVRELLRGQSITKWVIVSTGMFIPFIFEPAFDVANKDTNMVTALGTWENQLTVTDPEDIGKIVADIALVYTDVKGVIFVSGDTISMAQIVDVMKSVRGSKVTSKLKTVEDLKTELKRDPRDAMRKYRVVFGEGVGVAWPKETSFNVEHNVATKTVQQWAEEHL